MKKIILLCLGLGMATVSQAAGDRSIVLSTAGDVDFALVDAVRNHLEKYTGVQLRLGAPVPSEEGETLEEVGRTAARSLGEADHSVLVLARPLDNQPQGICLPHERFAVLNIAKLEVGADEKQLERRVDREGLRVMAMLLDMSQCPFPLCVLVSYKTVEDLDTMSASYCPPCQDRFHRLAAEAGLRLVDADPVAAAPAAPVAPAPAAAE
jgi:hypothetical protein